MNDNFKYRFGLKQSAVVFGLAAFALLIETRFLIPYLSQKSGLEPIIFWFLVAGLGLFLPLLVVSYVILRIEGLPINKRTWIDRLRFRKMTRTDWWWSIGSVIVIGILSLLIIKSIESLTGEVDSNPSFMQFEPLTPDRYWILLLWFPYWTLNIMGEEILWRGVILPGQEPVFHRYAWLVNGVFWSVFHIVFGWKLLLIMLPILFILPYCVQQRQNSWIGVFIHAVINGPSFLAISFGLL